jgi:hypothetical protein
MNGAGYLLPPYMYIYIHGVFFSKARKEMENTVKDKENRRIANYVTDVGSLL